MDFNSKFALIISLFALTFVLNVPFGYLRGKEKKFSFKWWLYIHIPIPLIIFARISSQLDFRYIPILIFAAVIGQFCGGKLEL